MKQTESIQVELGGRKAADAAFWFALAGVTDTSLIESLADICAKELERFGSRHSCRSKDIWHVLHRLAASGIRSNPALQQAAVTALARKDNELHSLNPSDLLNLHSDHCLVMIWRFSTRQRKQRAFLQSALQHWQRHNSESISSSCVLHDNKATQLSKTNWPELYKDPTRPLVIDIGCGMGVSLLGLAQCDHEPSSSLGDWSEYNYAGVDLSGLAIGYARGLSYRWGLHDRLQFFLDDAESFMRRVVNSYPGPVKFCFLQFPTPYRLQLSDVDDNNERFPPASERIGNSQLPLDVTSGFMVTKHLLRLIHIALRNGDANETGNLLIQSNCEDVAVWMRRMAFEVGFQYVQSHSESELLSSKVRIRIPKRTLDWIAMGGERAEGEGWGTRTILPRIGQTETDIACMLNGTPVHRCLLIPIEPAILE